MKLRVVLALAVVALVAGGTWFMTRLRKMMFEELDAVRGVNRIDFAFAPAQAVVLLKGITV